jgi:hypothetical protein
LTSILFDHAILVPSNGEHFLQVRTQKMLYLTKTEEEKGRFSQRIISTTSIFNNFYSMESSI